MPQLAPNQQPVNSDEEPPPVPVHMRKPETVNAIKERRAGIHSVYGNVPIFKNALTLQVIYLKLKSVLKLYNSVLIFRYQ
jgi:hypothetical protein